MFNRWLTLDITTHDIKENCNDLKVLGKGDFKTLMRWRTTLREEVSITPNLLLYVLTFRTDWIRGQSEADGGAYRDCRDHRESRS